MVDYKVLVDGHTTGVVHKKMREVCEELASKMKHMSMCINKKITKGLVVVPPKKICPNEKGWRADVAMGNI